MYDCFCFYNEFEILKIRLEELWDSVDYFVLVESIETQRGNPKPLYFEENKELFQKYLSKIIHITVQERHPEFGLWEREWYQRNCISRGLTTCDLNDIIMISDVDEIPRNSQLPSFIQTLNRQTRMSERRIGAIGLQQSIYFYQLNRQTPTKETWGGGWWVGTVLTTYQQLIKTDPQYFRNNRGNFPLIYNAGWHFTWMGGKEKVRQKLLSVVEGSDDPLRVTDASIQKALDNHPIVPLDSSFPAYILDNIEYFKSIGFIGE